jgi:hypothetical protein
MGSTQQEEKVQVKDLEMTDISGNGVSFVPTHGTGVSGAKKSSTMKATERADRSASAKRKGTGPRTVTGKSRSTQNSTKHGIFSKVVLLKDEPRDEYESMLNGLRNDLQPVGTLEIVLVDKLSALLWRQRRLLIAEGAEIRKGKEFVEWDAERNNETSAARISGSITNLNGGLVREIANPNILQRCLDLLEELKLGLMSDGFDIESDKPILTILYGEYREEDWRDTLFHSYLYWVAKGHFPKERDRPKENDSLDKCKEQFLEELEAEINRLSRHKKNRALTESERMKIVSLSRSVPDGVQLDRLLRYEVTLDRETDRLLRRLERLQRMRLGQPLPPLIEVSVAPDE